MPELLRVFRTPRYICVKIQCVLPYFRGLRGAGFYVELFPLWNSQNYSFLHDREWTQEQVSEESVDVPASSVPLILGKHGSGLKNVAEKAGMRTITLSGPREQLEKTMEFVKRTVVRAVSELDTSNFRSWSSCECAFLHDHWSEVNFTKKLSFWLLYNYSSRRVQQFQGYNGAKGIPQLTSSFILISPTSAVIWQHIDCNTTLLLAEPIEN